MSTNERQGLVSVEFTRFYLVGYPYSPVDDPREHIPAPGELWWATADGIGFQSAASGHRASVRLLWHTAPPQGFTGGTRVETFTINAPRIMFMTTTGTPEIVVPARHVGSTSATVTRTGMDDILTIIQRAPHESVTDAERWTIHLWPTQPA